ncbi:MAG TPA: hypothetical protein VM534_11390 [Thermoanaerobaculia bacterium]|nr:hypothetical protein [Thermoanaerobaculia bacterium]
MAKLKPLALLGLGCGFLVLLGVAAMVGLFVWVAAEPENIEVTIEAPLNVSEGERFPARVRIRNTASDQQRLVSLDVADEYLAGIAIERTNPPFSSATHIPIDDTMSYDYDLVIPPGKEVEVQFDLFAVREGDFSGEIDVCINSSTNFLSYPIRTIVASR